MCPYVFDKFDFKSVYACGWGQICLQEVYFYSIDVVRSNIILW